MFCCGEEAGDSIEHYSRCIVVHRFASTFVGLIFPRAEGLAIFTLCHSLLDRRDALVRSAIMLYAVWRVTEKVRHHTGEEGCDAAGMYSPHTY